MLLLKILQYFPLPLEQNLNSLLQNRVFRPQPLSTLYYLSYFKGLFSIHITEEKN